MSKAKTVRELIKETINYIKPYSELCGLRGSLIFEQVVIWLNNTLTALDAEQKEKERLEDDVIKYNDICVKERREKKELKKLLQQCVAEQKEKEKIVEETTANLLCYMIDNHEGEPLFEQQLQDIGIRFLKSKYNQALTALDAEQKEKE